MRRPAKRCCVRKEECDAQQISDADRGAPADLRVRHGAGAASAAAAGAGCRRRRSPAASTSAAMFTTTDGDEARYERYRDTRDGVYSSFNAQPRDGRRICSTRLRRTSATAISATTSTYLRPTVNVRTSTGHRCRSTTATSRGRRTSTNGTTLTLRRQRAARGAGSDQRHQRRHGGRRAVRAGRAAGRVRHRRRRRRRRRRTARSTTAWRRSVRPAAHAATRRPRR